MIKKSLGTTETECMLAEFCERTFLKLWSYPNQYKDDGHELCDLLAVFGDYVFIFFDRENIFQQEKLCFRYDLMLLDEGITKNALVLNLQCFADITCLAIAEYGAGLLT